MRSDAESSSAGEIVANEAVFSVFTWPLYPKVMLPKIPAKIVSSFFDSSGYPTAEQDRTFSVFLLP
jgi:hypothetical protein